MGLIDLVREAPGRLVAPLMGAPGAALTGSTLRQNLFNAALQRRSLAALAERYRPDALFFMMDLSVEAGALGLPVRYPAHEAPTVEEHPVRALADLEPYRVPDPLEDARVRMYLELTRALARDLPCLTGAYVTGPFTLAGLLMGASEIAVATIEQPDLVAAVVAFAEGVITRYAQALVAAGARLVAILEPTAVLLSPAAFARCSGAAVARIAAALDAMTVLHICGDTTRLVPAMCATGVQGLSLDGPVDLARVAPLVPPDVALIGNLDPVRVMLDETPDGVRRAAAALLERMAPFPNFILSTGCDLPPETPHANIRALMEAGRAYGGARR